jgi:uncharacterized membrane protein
MIVWGLVAGALLGWGTNGFDSDALWPGAIIGALMGWWLRKIVRQEVAVRLTSLTAELAEARREAALPAVPHVATPVAPPVQPSKIAPPPPTLEPVSPPHTRPDLPQPPPREPNVVEQLFVAARGWLLGGNTIVRVGLVILFVGLSFLAHYAADAGLFPIELRLVLVAAAGIALLCVGFLKRLQKPDFALTLQGGGVAILYLTVFAASRLFEVIPAAAAFPIMIVVCALGCALALLQNSQLLAATSFVGGFAVPILLGGEGSTLGLFGYYTVLNLAVLAIAWRRSWRMINLISFVATFGLATAWGVLVYDPALYGVCQCFLILFVLIYVGAGILHAQGRPGSPGNVVDSSLLFGPAIVGFGLQVGLVRDMPLGSAFSALGFGALYLALAVFVTKRGRGDNRVLTDGLIAVAVGFVTLAVPLALGVRWTATVWALEGAGAFWVGMRQARWLPRAFGLLLQGAGGLVFIACLKDLTSTLPLLNPNTLGAVLIALPAFATAWWLRRPLDHSNSRWALGYARIEPEVAKPAFLYGFAFWCFAFMLELNRHLPPLVAGEFPQPAILPSLIPLLTMLAFVVSAGIAAVVGRRTDWRVATWPSHVAVAALVVGLFTQWGAHQFVLQTPQWIIWLLAIGLHYRLLWANDQTAKAGTAPLRRVVHVGSVWLLTAMLLDGLWFGIDRGDLWRTSWASVVMLVGTTGALLVLTLWAANPSRHTRWPLREHAGDYALRAAIPIAVLVYAGALITALFASGKTDPLPYLPLINPVDLAVALAIAALALWLRTIDDPAKPAGRTWLTGRQPLVALTALAFVAINTVWLRVAHHLLAVAWNPDALLGSFVVQTGLSILWTLLALGLTLMAHRRGLRAMWLTGGGLLAAVVLKLLVVDLSNEDGGARIVTFIVVGVLMLVVGYFAPLPPRSVEPQS